MFFTMADLIVDTDKSQSIETDVDQLASSSFHQSCKKILDETLRNRLIVLKKDDFKDSNKFKNIVDLFVIGEDPSDVDEIAIIPEDVVVYEDAGGGMGSAGYVSASVNDSGSDDAIFVPARLFPKSKGKHIFRRKSLEKKKK